MTAITRRRVGAGTAAITLLFMLQMVVFGAVAQAEHIPATGPIPNNCAEFTPGQTGSTTLAGATVEITSWDGDSKGFDFSVSGLSGSQTVDISVKYGNAVEEIGPFGNGLGSYSNDYQNAISHIRVCVFGEAGTTTTVEPGYIIVKKVVVVGSKTKVFDFDGAFENGLADGQSSGPIQVAPGTYQVTEDLNTPSGQGWEIPKIDCDDLNSTWSGATATYRVEAGETVTCVFTNTYEESTTTTSSTTTSTSSTTTTSSSTTTTSSPRRPPRRPPPRRTRRRRPRRRGRARPRPRWLLGSRG